MSLLFFGTRVSVMVYETRGPLYETQQSGRGPLGGYHCYVVVEAFLMGSLQARHWGSWECLQVMGGWCLATV